MLVHAHIFHVGFDFFLELRNGAEGTPEGAVIIDANLVGGNELLWDDLTPVLVVVIEVDQHLIWEPLVEDCVLDSGVFVHKVHYEGVLNVLVVRLLELLAETVNNRAFGWHSK